jgi:hypothetical protein
LILNFSNQTAIDTPWFSLPVGKEFEYEGETEDGMKHIEIEITDEIKTVMGIKTLVYCDAVPIDGEVVGDTRNCLAQDDDGNVWYFDEDEEDDDDINQTIALRT